MSLARELLVIFLLASLAVVLGQSMTGRNEKYNSYLSKKYREYKISKDLGKNGIKPGSHAKLVFPKKVISHTVGRPNPKENARVDFSGQLPPNGVNHFSGHPSPKGENENHLSSKLPQSGKEHFSEEPSPNGVENFLGQPSPNKENVFSRQPIPNGKEHFSEQSSPNGVNHFSGHSSPKGENENHLSSKLPQSGKEHFSEEPSANGVENFLGQPSPNEENAFSRQPIPNEKEHSSGQQSPEAVGVTPCQTAEQWEGRASELDHISGIDNRFNITYDGIHRRKRIMEDKHAQLLGKRIYEYIMLYDEGIQYVINHNYNTCTVESLGTWRSFTIPPNSTLEDSYEIGTPGSGFMVQEWSDRIPGRQKETWIGTYTYPGCWPMKEIFMERDEENRIVHSVTTRFFDLHAGIKNLSVFTPPAFCKNAQRPIIDSVQSTTPSSKPVRPSETLDQEPDNVQGILDQMTNEDMSGEGSGDEMSGEGSGNDLSVDWSGVNMPGDEMSGDEMSGEGSGVDLSVDWSGVNMSGDEMSGDEMSGEGSGDHWSVDWSGVDMSGDEMSGDEMSGEGSGDDLSVEWSGVDISGEGSGEGSGKGSREL